MPGHLSRTLLNSSSKHKNQERRANEYSIDGGRLAVISTAVEGHDRMSRLTDTKARALYLDSDITNHPSHIGFPLVQPNSSEFGRFQFYFNKPSSDDFRGDWWPPVWVRF